MSAPLRVDYRVYLPALELQRALRDADLLAD